MTQKAVLISQQRSSPSFSKFCVYQLPEGPYLHLQWAMGSSDYSDNRVVARQNDCSTLINLNEHHEFGSLRAGRHLQLMNILRALASQSLNLRNVAVQTMISQVLWEFRLEEIDNNDADFDSATSGSHIGITHAAFDDELFCEKFLLVLGTITEQTSLSTAEQNTDCLVLVTILVLRLASFATSEDIRARSSKQLRILRESSLKLLRRLAKGSTVSKDSKASCSGVQLFKLATLVKMTFDVDVADIPHVLHDDQDVEDFTTASLTVRENLPGDTQSLAYHAKEMVLKGFEISKTLKPALRALVLHSSKGVTAALLTRCKKTTLEGQWTFLNAPNKRNPWAENQTPSPSPSVLHYNILNGEFTVDGQSIQMVPSDIERSPTYRRVFGKVSILEGERNFSTTNRMIASFTCAAVKC